MIVTCASCGSAVVPRTSDGSCPACGGAARAASSAAASAPTTADANPYAPPQSSARPGERGKRIGPYRPANGLVAFAVTTLALATVMSGVQFVMLLVNGLPELSEASLLRRRPEQVLSPRDYVNLLAGLVMAVAAVAYCTWFHRANTNARALGARYLQYGPNAWGWFFCPLANLAVPYFAVRELFRCLEPRKATPQVFPLWWTLWVTATLVPLVGGFMAGMSRSGAWLGKAAVQAGQGATIGAGLCAIAVVLAIQRRHEAAAAAPDA